MKTRNGFHPEEALTKEVTEKKQEIISQELMEERLKQYSEIISRQDERISALNEQIRELKENLEKAENNLKTAEDNIEYKEQRISGLEESLKKAKDEAMYLSRRAQEAENTKHGLEAELKETAEILEETRDMIRKANEYRITPPAGMRIASIYFSVTGEPGEQEEEE